MKRRLLAVVAAIAVSMVGGAAIEAALPEPVAPERATANEHLLDPRVVGGGEVSPVGKYSFIVGLLDTTDPEPSAPFCGGTLIAPEWVLSAGHCFDANFDGTQDVFTVDVLVGRHDVSVADGQRIASSSITVHPSYATTFENDLALIKLSTPALLGPVAMAEAADSALFNPPTLGTVMGWGLISQGPSVFPDKLHSVDVPFITDADCSDPLVWDGSVYPAIQLCAGGPGVDSCIGDSGGPLITPAGPGPYLQAGLVSAGPGTCGHPVLPRIYAEIAAFRSWISGITGPTAPSAIDDAVSVDEDTATLLTLAANDVDIQDTRPSGDATAMTLPTHGDLVDSGDGTFTYTPDLDYAGMDGFTYSILDVEGAASNTATVTITVDAVNDEPSFDLVGSPNQSVDEDDPAQSVPAFVTGPDKGAANESGQTLTLHVSDNNAGLFTASGRPAINLVTGELTYTPAADANGSATVSVFITDDGGVANGGDDTSPTQTFTITVDAVNDEPSFDLVGAPDQSVDEDDPAQSVPTFLTGSDKGAANESGQTLTLHVSDNNAGLFTASGRPAINLVTGELTYTPAADANGSATVSVFITDDGGVANGGDDTSPTQTFTITVDAVNDAPSFDLPLSPDRTVLKDSGPLAESGFATNISVGPPDEAGQVFDFTVTNDNAALFSSPPDIDKTTGTLSFTPATGAAGTAEVTVIAMDDGGTANGGADTSGPQTFTITVSAAPVAADDAYSVFEDGTLTTTAGVDGVADNDTDFEDGSPPGGPVMLASLPAHDPGFTLNGDGSFAYNPPNDFSGVDSFTYTVMDSDGFSSNVATATITIHPVNDAPSFTAGADLIVAKNAGPQSVDGFASSISPGPDDESGQTVSFVVSNDNNALFAAHPAISVDGTLTFSATGGSVGSAIVTVAAMDDGGGDDTSPPQTFTISVEPTPHTTGLVDISSGKWYLRNSAGSVTSFFYGDPGDLPIAGDWDGDGISTPGLYRQEDGFFYARDSNSQGSADAECFAGNADDVPLSGDWDGDGDDNLGLYRPSEQTFYLFTISCTGSPMGAAAISIGFGDPGDKPVSGDWDGDGIDEIGLHRESTGLFYWKNELTTGNADDAIIFGNPADRFVAGDWGILDDVDTPALFRPFDRTFYFRHSLTQGNADSQFIWIGSDGGWLPVAGAFGLD